MLIFLRRLPIKCVFGPVMKTVNLGEVEFREPLRLSLQPVLYLVSG
jgi:hypothetical protein